MNSNCKHCWYADQRNAMRFPCSDKPDCPANNKQLGSDADIDKGINKLVDEAYEPKLPTAYDMLDFNKGTDLDDAVAMHKKYGVVIGGSQLRPEIDRVQANALATMASIEKKRKGIINRYEIELSSIQSDHPLATPTPFKTVYFEGTEEEVEQEMLKHVDLYGHPYTKEEAHGFNYISIMGGAKVTKMHFKDSGKVTDRGIELAREKEFLARRKDMRIAIANKAVLAPKAFQYACAICGADASFSKAHSSLTGSAQELMEEGWAVENGALICRDCSIH